MQPVKIQVKLGPMPNAAQRRRAQHAQQPYMRDSLCSPTHRDSLALRRSLQSANMGDSAGMIDAAVLNALDDLRAASPVLEEEWLPGSAITTWRRVKLDVESELDVEEL